MTSRANQPRAHAIVMGASLGGLMTARALSHHFQKVTLIERDVVNRQPESRQGQPQTRHLHGLLPGGFRIMMDYFPDLRQALADAGANVCDFANTMTWFTHGGYRKSFDMNLPAVTMSRPLLEHLIRERVLALPNVQLIDNCSVQRLDTDADRQRVTGLTVLHKTSRQLDSLTADLVIDATGRGSRSPQWLGELGYDAPPVSEVKVKVGYTTRIYERDPNDRLTNHWILCTPAAPSERRFGGLFPVEGNRWVVTVGGWHGDSAPVDEPGFLEFARSLPATDIYDIISRSEPLSDPIPYRFPSSLRRHYERLNRFPLGYLVLGDAISSFNPTYGQGMTSATMQAAALDRLLADNPSDEKLAKTFFQRAAKVVDIPWQLTVGEDFRYPETEGPKPAAVDFLNKYVSRVQRATLRDEVVCAAFLRVMSLLKPPTSLFHPRILWRVMTAA
ncbi:FAD-dependent monooxygenase [Spirosoma taeanense]|uniref:FAD-dependent monooxygenase n=1 Tax=Spirosoma taeanense TaxID=2735870 RepID=A0A6M5YBB4_9BACT|nr:FAD-dependent monooxygenase [Spirosoma taeanense]QJW90543.1 FAD-dependent monooxygenase [Spirosoma taeanense]